MTTVHDVSAPFLGTPAGSIFSHRGGSFDVAEALHQALTHLQPLEQSDPAARDSSRVLPLTHRASVRPSASAVGAVGDTGADVRASRLGATASSAPMRELDEASLRGIAESLSLSSDPMLMLLGLAETIHRSDSSLQRDDAHRGATEGARAIKQQRAARRRSARASRRARRWLGRAPKWLKKLISAVISAAGIAGAAFTGGATLGLAIAGTALMMGSELIVKAAKAMGLSDKAANILGACVQIAGAALSGCSGLASGPGRLAATVGQSVVSAVRTAQQATSLVGGVLGATEATRGLGASVMTYRATSASLDAESWGVESDRVDAATGDLIAEMRQTAAAFNAASDRLLDAIAIRRNRDDAIVAGIGR